MLVEEAFGDIVRIDVNSLLHSEGSPGWCDLWKGKERE